MTSSPHVRSIPHDLVFTILSCGLFNLWVQAKQMEAVNDMLGEDRYVWLHWFLLTLVTCGLYHVYHEYRKTVDIDECLGNLGSSEPIISVLLTVVGLSWVGDAIQQSHINRFYGDERL